MAALQHAMPPCRPASPSPHAVAPAAPPCAAAPTLLVEARPARPHRPRRRRSSAGGASSSAPAGGGSSDEGSSSSEPEDGDDSFSSGGSSGPAGWQVRRSKSWDGHLQDTSTLGDSLPLVGCRELGGIEPAGACISVCFAAPGALEVWGRISRLASLHVCP